MVCAGFGLRMPFDAGISLTDAAEEGLMSQSKDDLDLAEGSSQLAIRLVLLPWTSAVDLATTMLWAIA